MAGPPMPARDPMTDPVTGLIRRTWQVWLRNLTNTVNDAPVRIQTVSLSGQAASIGTTSIPSVPLSTGLYRVTWYLRITTAAATSSSLTVSFGWTDDTVTMSLSGAAVTGNTTTTSQTGTALLAADNASPVTYATSYTSVGTPAMQYALNLILEAVSA
jgi:hypothetical protein